MEQVAHLPRPLCSSTRETQQSYRTGFLERLNVAAQETSQHGAGLSPPNPQRDFCFPVEEADFPASTPLYATLTVASRPRWRFPLTGPTTAGA